MKQARLVWIIVFAALGVCLWQGWQALHDPLFNGDTGYRLFYSERPILKIGNRIWLPFVQVHIWVYRQLGLPFEGLKLITVAYAGAGLCFLGLYWRRMLGGGIWATIAGALAVVCYSAQTLTRSVSELMQEPAGTGLFFFFIWCATRGGPMPWLSLAAGCAAMLTRDMYWIVLFAFTLVDLRNWPWGRRRILFYAALWATPILWLCGCVPAMYWMAYRRLPKMPVEWPLGYNPSLRHPAFEETVASLWDGLTGPRLVYVAAGMMIAAAILWVWRRRRPGDPLVYGRDSVPLMMLPAAGLALAVAYALILAIDPWQETPGNWRQAWPLHETAFVVAPILMRMASTAPARVRMAVVSFVVLGLLSGVGFRARQSREIPLTAVAAELGKLKARLDAAEGGAPVGVCLTSEPQWSTYSDLSGPVFYHRHTYYWTNRPMPEHCRFLVVEDSSKFTPAEPFVQRDRLDTGRYHWTVYERPGRDSRAPGS